jgi:succinyldiaminopimelate transaminase
MPRLNPIFDHLKTYPQQALNERKNQLKTAGKKIYDFGIGDPIEPAPEFIRQALRDAVQHRCGYPKVAGSPSIRKAICEYIQRRFDLTLDPEQHVLPLSGAKEGVFHMPLLVIDPNVEDRIVVFPDPGYPAYHRGALFAGGISYPVALQDDYIFRPWELDEDVLKKTRLMWLNSPHNPSGVVMGLDDLQRIADLCRKYDILCVSDETYADIYDNEPPASILETGLENVLVIHSLSKRSGMTGYRSGFVAGDPFWIQKLYTLRANPGLVPQTFINAAAEVAWQDDEHVAQRRARFRTKKEIFLKFFDEQGWNVLGRHATLYLWLRVPNGDSGRDYALRLLEEGIVVSPGNMFSIANNGGEYIRLAMVPSLEECKETVDLWRNLR